MKRSKRAQRRREKYAFDLRRQSRTPIVSQPIDHRAPTPDDARLLADLEWIQGLRDGYIPSASAQKAR